MPTDKLTDTKCKSAKRRERAYKIFDGNSLYLFVTPAGAKVWRLAYRLNGKQQTMSFGPYPEVTLAQARAKRDEARAALRDGADPMAPRRAARPGITFKEAAVAYWAGRGDVSEGYRTNATKALEKHAYPLIGARPVAGLTREDIMSVLSPMNAAQLYVYVRKVKLWTGMVMDWCVEQGHCQINPAALIRTDKAFGRAPVEHFAAVTLPEVGPLLQRLALEHELQSVLACRLLALTWVRTGELRMMLWDEIDGDVWRIPAGKMKMRRDHLVPLSRQALEVLATLEARRVGKTAYVFPSDRRLDRPMSENSILYLLHRIGYKDRHTGHGWRTVASTWANEHGYSADAIERQLAHAPKDEVRAAYNRAEFMDARRLMLQAWADWLDRQAAGT